METSEHKHVRKCYHGYYIHISYWVNYGRNKRIVKYAVSRKGESGLPGIEQHGGYIRSTVGGRSIFGFQLTEDRGFEDMIQEGIRRCKRWAEKDMDGEPPDPEALGM